MVVDNGSYRLWGLCAEVLGVLAARVSVSSRRPDEKTCSDYNDRRCVSVGEGLRYEGYSERRVRIVLQVVATTVALVEEERDKLFTTLLASAGSCGFA